VGCSLGGERKEEEEEEVAAESIRRVLRRGEALGDEGADATSAKECVASNDGRCDDISLNVAALAVRPLPPAAAGEEGSDVDGDLFFLTLDLLPRLPLPLPISSSSSDSPIRVPAVRS
jgi:hypothetical protein